MQACNFLGKLRVKTIQRWSTIAPSAAIAVALTVCTAQPVQAQMYQVLHNFTGGADGGTPQAGLTIQGPSLYGTAYGGGTHGAGTAYRLRKRGSNWTFAPLYSFDPNHGDGSGPVSRVVFGPNGLLYGTTSQGGAASGGTVFKLQPRPSIPPSPLTPWNETVLYSFMGGSGGQNPLFGEVVFDAAGNMYGTAYIPGIVWQLTPPGTWGTETVLVTLTGGNGSQPYGGLSIDDAGNLYGTTWGGGSSGCCGVVFQIVPVMGGWSENVLYNFQNGNDGAHPIANPIFDSAGNLYGSSSDTGTTGTGGTVFELSPSGSWTTFTPLYGLPLGTLRLCPTAVGNQFGPGPWASLAMDTVGNLYGTSCVNGAFQKGSVFKLTRSGDSWTYTDLHDFTGGSDGAYPISNVVFDGNGNLYGTASAGGSQGFGVVWEITP